MFVSKSIVATHISATKSSQCRNHSRSMLRSSSLLLLAFLAVSQGDKPKLGLVRWSVEEHRLSFEATEELANFAFSKDVVAKANFTNAVNSTGWAFFEVVTNQKFPDHIQAYAAGYVEGKLSFELIHKYWHNVQSDYCKSKQLFCQHLADYVHNNTAWVLKRVSKLRHKSRYWHQVGLFYDQMRGITDGYNEVTNNTGLALPHGAIFMLNMAGDLEDLEPALAANFGFENSDPTRVLGSGSCSALIKLTANNEDLLVAHTTWSRYNSMLRVLKKYTLNLHETHKGQRLIRGTSMSMSSYPGVLYSDDDFTLINSGLVTIETTIGNTNKKLWSNVRSKGQVLEGIRSTVANRLASSGEEWSKLFSKHNSGTYNNQWMIVDYKQFKRGQSIKQGLLYVLEQLPGHIEYGDVSRVLKNQHYWPSYNTPYFKKVFEMGGFQVEEDKFGDWFSYLRTPRALIFARDEHRVKDLGSMLKLMRSNDFYNDPLAKCDCQPLGASAENAIAARNDLNPANGTYPFPALNHRPHGATDAKVADLRLVNELNILAVAGPTDGNGNLPKFSWSKSDFRDTEKHLAQPDHFDFKPIITDFKL